MKKLNQKSTKIFNKIVDGMDSDGYRKIDNGGNCFMPLVVEKLGTHDSVTTFSFCHYFKQNGDMCQDPEMLFLRHVNGSVYPAMFQMAIPPVYEESIMFEDGRWLCRERLQRQHTSFANTWLKNIKEQQGL